MMLPAEDFDRQTRPVFKTRASGRGPVIRETAWGYIVRATDAEAGRHFAGSLAGRIAAALLLLLVAGLWILPEARDAARPGIRLAATVAALVTGGLLLRAGRNARLPECRIDLEKREIQLGTFRRGAFRASTRVAFTEVTSIVLLEPKPNRPTRLLLRLAGRPAGVEIAHGSPARMDALKHRLSDDLSGKARQPVARQLGRHQRLAA